ncbi:similar to An01g00420 [Aspergillus luchuensis IFO 4308]|nr:similar to An01g00420 [Aspergillus luchuensis IFO 4308]
MERAASPVSTLVGLATRADPSPLPPPQEIFVHIQEMYDSGKPFYTKELLQNLKQQIQDARDGVIQTIRVPGLDGVIVEFPVLIGQVYPAHDEPGMEYVIQNPCISYLSLQELLDDDNLGDYLPYNHIEIGHYKYLRDIHTKELYLNSSVHSVPDASKLLQESRQIWENTTECQELRVKLMSRKTVPITKIVGIALGSFATVYPELQDRSVFQHALLLTLRDIYCKMHNVSQDAIPCFAQDPECKKNDIVAAGENGIKIVEDPDAFLEVDESTVVVSVAPDIAVRQIVFDIARPAVLIWNKVRDENEDHM